MSLIAIEIQNGKSKREKVAILLLDTEYFESKLVKYNAKIFQIFKNFKWPHNTLIPSMIMKTLHCRDKAIKT